MQTTQPAARFVAVVPPRKAAGKIPALDGAMVIITSGEKKESRFALKTMDDVRLALRGIFPSKWRRPDPSEDISSVIPLHKKWREPKKDETEATFAGHHPSQVVRVEKRNRGTTTVKVVQGVAAELSGVQSGDTAASFFGSTGGLVLAGLIHRIKEGVSVRGITRFGFEGKKPECAEEERAAAIAELLAKENGDANGLFYPVFESSLPEIEMAEKLDAHTNTQRARIAQGNRVFAATRARMFLDPVLFGSDEEIETLAEKEMKRDAVHAELKVEEARLKKELEEILGEIPIYPALRTRVKGAAVSILAPIIAETLTIKRFPKMGSARTFWGVGVRDGQFMRKMGGKPLGYNPVCRQAMYQFGMQIVKGGAEEFWMERYAENVAMYKARHPAKVLVEIVQKTVEGEKKWVESGRRFPLIEGAYTEETPEGAKKKVRTFTREDGKTVRVANGFVLYNPGHLLKMGLWRTLTEFADWLYFFWRTFESLDTRPPKAFPPEDADAVRKAAAEWFSAHPPKVEHGQRQTGAIGGTGGKTQAAA